MKNKRKKENNYSVSKFSQNMNAIRCMKNEDFLSLEQNRKEAENSKVSSKAFIQKL